MTPRGAWYAEARENYRKSLRGKLENVELLLAAYESNGSPESRDALREALHRIRGSAGSYDYAHLGQICAACEEELILRSRGGEAATAIAGTLRLHLDGFVRLVQQEEDQR